MKNLHFKNNKGSILLYSVLIILVFSIAHVSLLTHTQNTALGSRKYVARIKGRYAALAGLRYASILLRNPSVFGFTALGAPGDPSIPETYTVIGTELGGNFFSDIGADSKSLIITITETNNGNSPTEYELKAVFNIN
jgi:hypothetical protein